VNDENNVISNELSFLRLKCDSNGYIFLATERGYSPVQLRISIT